MIGCPREHSVLEGYGFSRAALTAVFEGRVGHGAFAARLKPCLTPDTHRRSVFFSFPSPLMLGISRTCGEGLRVQSRGISPFAKSAKDGGINATGLNGKSGGAQCRDLWSIFRRG